MLSTGKMAEDKQREVASLFSIEIFFAVMIPLVLNVLWAPVLDMVSKGKYGSSNAVEFLILSVCIPFQFAINILWTLAFASKRYKPVSIITIVTSASNLLLNLAFIPLFGGVGAAIVFLVTIILQAGLYYYLVRKRVMHLPVKPFIAFILMGAAAYMVANALPVHFVLKLGVALVAYILLSLSLRQINRGHFLTLKTYLTK
jgi:O-antigen/teichoic acid export membrane protein